MSFMDDAASQMNPRDIDWVSLNRRLLACAVRLFKGQGCYGPDSMLPNTGMCARDLAAKTIVELLKDDQWQSTSQNSDPFPFALIMMKRDFLDLVKRPEFKRTVIIESDDAGFGQQETGSSCISNNGFEAVENAAFVESLKRILRPDSMMAGYLEAVVVKGLSKRTDIAYELGLTEQEVTNIKRKLIYKARLIRRAITPGRMATTKKV
jgi:hypothetical protein